MCPSVISVYEETAGLTVNDPVLRTHKVRDFFILFFLVSLQLTYILYPELFSLFLWSLDQESWEISSMEFRFSWISNLEVYYDIYVSL